MSVTRILDLDENKSFQPPSLVITRDNQDFREELLTSPFCVQNLENFGPTLRPTIQKKRDHNGEIGGSRPKFDIISRVISR